jgi:UDP-N-acetylmuramoyl-tripeptide--D-alanyl-D-alanine ligase
MERFTGAEAERAMGARRIGAEVAEVTRVTSDTRAEVAGSLFFALKGETMDGHDYAAEALAKGAAAIVVDHPLPEASGTQLVVEDTTVALGDLARWYRDRFDLPVVGVTGSVGKTSTKEMIAHVLRARFTVLSSEKNFNNEFGVPRTLFELSPAHTAAVIEMGMRGAGQIARLAEIARPTVGVVTNIGLSHVELLGSRENIARAKGELLEALGPGGTAVLPADDDFAVLLRELAGEARVVTFGASECADFQVTDLSFSDEGQPRFRVNGHPVRLGVFGVHHAVNAAAACATAHALGMGLEETATALEAFRAPAMRMETERGANGCLILNDAYNAAPDSMRAALETLRMLANGRRAVAVLGDMKELGTHAEEAHRLVGRLAAESGVGLLIAVGELSRKTIEEAVRAGLPSDGFRLYTETDEAVHQAPGLVRPEDAVLVKGSRAMGLEKVVDALRAGR